MCAIAGWAGTLKRGQWSVVRCLLNELMIASAVRGTDATGFAALDRRKGFVTAKAAIPSPLFKASSGAWASLHYPTCVVLHTRMATHGLPDRNENNHPFVDDDEKVAVVVNGVSNNYLKIAHEYDLSLRTECDSEVVLRLVEADEHPVYGLDIALSDLTGGIAAAVLDVSNETVWLVRNDARPLWLFEVAGINGRFFCSTSEIAKRSLRRVFGHKAKMLLRTLVPIASHQVIGLSGDGRMIAVQPEPDTESIIRFAQDFAE